MISLNIDHQVTAEPVLSRSRGRKRSRRPCGGSRKQVGSVLAAVLFLACAVILFFCVMAVRAVNQARQARFNIDVLQQIIYSYRTVGGQQIKKISGIPDFHVVSPENSLSVQGKDLRRGILGGYVYDMENLPDGKYVISASPIGSMNSGIEFAINEQGVLRMNQDQVDSTADSSQETEKWQAIPRIESARSADQPAYVRE